MTFNSFSSPVNCAVFGASGGIGSAFVDALAAMDTVRTVHAVSRTPAPSANSKVVSHTVDPLSDSSLSEVVEAAGDLDLAIIAVGMLHGHAGLPEKSVSHLSPEGFSQTMEVNALVPTLIAKALMPQMKKSRKRFVLAALSARVGSISDNRLGGWHSYRASKAALNQLYKNVALETAHRNPEAVVVTLHPGTVDTALSEPFQKNVPDGKLFTPSYSAQEMLSVLDTLTPDQSGKCFDYAGLEIAP